MLYLALHGPRSDFHPLKQQLTCLTELLHHLNKGQAFIVCAGCCCRVTDAELRLLPKTTDETTWCWQILGVVDAISVLSSRIMSCCRYPFQVLHPAMHFAGQSVGLLD